MFQRNCQLYHNYLLNDLLGGRGWWLVKGGLVRAPFLLQVTEGGEAIALIIYRQLISFFLFTRLRQGKRRSVLCICISLRLMRLCG